MKNRIAEGILLISPTLIGLGSYLLTKDNMNIFEEVLKPPLTPPAVIFSIAWTILYLLMGIAATIVYTSKGNERERRIGLVLHTIQLILNFFWSLIFFNQRAYVSAFIWLILLWLSVLSMIINYRKVSQTACLLSVPYLAWLTLAAYLNLGICILN